MEHSGAVFTIHVYLGHVQLHLVHGVHGEELLLLDLQQAAPALQQHAARTAAPAPALNIPLLLCLVGVPTCCQVAGPSSAWLVLSAAGPGLTAGTALPPAQTRPPPPSSGHQVSPAWTECSAVQGGPQHLPAPPAELQTLVPLLRPVGVLQSRERRNDTEILQMKTYFCVQVGFEQDRLAGPACHQTEPALHQLAPQGRGPHLHRTIQRGTAELRTSM